MRVLPAYICLSAPHTWLVFKEDSRGCQAPCLWNCRQLWASTGHWELNLSLLEEQQALLTTKPSSQDPPQHQISCFYLTTSKTVLSLRCLFSFSLAPSNALSPTVWVTQTYRWYTLLSPLVQQLLAVIRILFIFLPKVPHLPVCLSCSSRQ